FEPLQRRAWFDPELVDQQPPCRLVGGERVRLPSAAVEREHQLSAHPLPQGMSRDQHLQLRHQRSVATEGELRLNSLLQREQSQLLEPPDLRLRERLVAEID